MFTARWLAVYRELGFVATLDMWSARPGLISPMSPSNEAVRQLMPHGFQKQLADNALAQQPSHVRSGNEVLNQDLGSPVSAHPHLQYVHFRRLVRRE